MLPATLPPSPFLRPTGYSRFLSALLWSSFLLWFAGFVVDASARRPRPRKTRSLTPPPASMAPDLLPSANDTDAPPSPKSPKSPSLQRFLWEDMSDGLNSLLVQTVAFDPTNPQRMYAAADGIIYRSDNGGLRWKALARFQGTSRTGRQGPSQQERINEIRERLLEEKLEDLEAEVGEERARDLAGSLEKEAEEEAEAQVQRQGRQRRETSGRLRRRIYRIVVSPTKPDHVLVATDGGAFISRNRGRKFETSFRGRGPGEGDVRTGVFDPTDEKIVWLGTNAGLWVSRDGGKKFDRIFGKLRRIPIREIRFDPNNPKRMYIATTRALFVTNNGGKTFDEPLTMASGQRRINSLALLPTKPTTLIVGTGGGLYRSTDGKKFNPLQAAGIGSRQTSYVTSCPAGPSYVYLINDRGVFLSTNRGKTFQQLRDGMLTLTILFIDVSPRDPLQIWAATEFGLLRWSPVLPGRITDAQWRRVQARFKSEPPVGILVENALRFMRLDEPLDSIETRFRTQYFLPEVRVQSQLDLSNELTSLQVPIPLEVRISEQRIFLIEAYAQWNIGRLIQAPEEGSLIQGLRGLRNARDKMITRVARLYFARQRLQMQMLTTRHTDLYRYLRLYLRLQEMTDYIDGMTGGYFRRALLSKQP